MVKLGDASQSVEANLPQPFTDFDPKGQRKHGHNFWRPMDTNAKARPFGRFGDELRQGLRVGGKFEAEGLEFERLLASIPKTQLVRTVHPQPQHLP